MAMTFEHDCKVLDPFLIKECCMSCMVHIIYLAIIKGPKFFDMMNSTRDIYDEPKNISQVMSSNPLRNLLFTLRQLES